MVRKMKTKTRNTNPIMRKGGIHQKPYKATRAGFKTLDEYEIEMLGKHPELKQFLDDARERLKRAKENG